MPKTVQIRNMPVEVHRTLKARAAAAGMTLSAYLIKEFERIAQTPTEADLERRAKELWGHLRFNEKAD